MHRDPARFPDRMFFINPFFGAIRSAKAAGLSGMILSLEKPSMAFLLLKDIMTQTI